MECPVCYNKKSSKFLVELECHHKLCHSCAYHWLLKNPTCPCCRQQSWYFTKPTRSLSHAHLTVKQAEYLWKEIRGTYNGSIPTNIFMEFVHHFFLSSEKNRAIWHRPQLVHYKNHFKFICQRAVPFDRLNEREREIYVDFLKSTP